MFISGFGPIVNKQCNTLILGSMPSVTSLSEHRYYAFSRNQFWRLVCDLFNTEYINNYEQRVKFLLSNKIALWDVVKSCVREGSLDTDIKKPLVNNFQWLFVTFPNIRTIVFNGAKSRQLFLRYVNERWYENKTLIKLPSSSPAYTMAYAKKLVEWQKAIINKSYINRGVK